MITTFEELQKLINRALKTDCIGLDTEFVWERTYFPQLGLIQMALSSDDCHLIDPTSISDLSPLKTLLESKETVKIFHDAPQDVAILQNATGAVAQNIFDTQLAAGFCGLPGNMSLGKLVDELLDIQLTKSETRTDWLKRPLDEKQIEYALDDVRYLRAARVVLLTRVYSPEVNSFLSEELATFLSSNNLNIAEDQRYTRVKGAGSLSRSSLGILKEITSYREQTAKKKNRPRGHIIPDTVLIKIARTKSCTKQDLHECGLSEKALKKYLTPLVGAIEKGLACPTNLLPDSLKLPRLSAKEKGEAEKLAKMIRLKSDTKGIDPTIIATTRDIKKYIKQMAGKTNAETAKMQRGWRARFLEEFFA